MGKTIIVGAFMLLWRTVVAVAGALAGGASGAVVGFCVVLILAICLMILGLVGIMPRWVVEYVVSPGQHDGMITDYDALFIYVVAWVGVVIGALYGFFYKGCRES